MPVPVADFNTCLDFVLRWEGGYADNTADTGGATNKGITLSTLADWRGAPVSKEDLYNLGDEEAVGIYQTKYWEPCCCADLPPALALVAFDTSVNSGAHRAVMFLQSALEMPADGICGPATIAAARICDQHRIIVSVIATRLAFLERLATWTVFGPGWSARCAALKVKALAMVQEG